MLDSLLAIQVTSGNPHSTTEKLVQTFCDEWVLVDSNRSLKIRALDNPVVPHLGQKNSGGTEDFFRRELIAELLEADHILLATPMWNWGPPSTLKAYLDHIIFPGVLDVSSNRHLAGKNMTLLVTQGGSTAPGTPKAGWDFITGYLELVFKGLGVSDLATVQVEFTMAGQDEQLNQFLELKEKSIREATHTLKSRASKQ